MEQWLASLGISVPNAIAGFAGGVASVFVRRQLHPFDATGSLVVGTLTANYLGDALVKLSGLPALATGFLVGLGGMQLCLLAMNQFRTWKLLPSQTPNGSSDGKGGKP